MADLLDCEGEPQVREHLVFLHAVSSLPPEMYTLSSLPVIIPLFTQVAVFCRTFNINPA